MVDTAEKDDSRSRNLANKRETEEHLFDLYDQVEKGFQDQVDRANDQSEYWECYNCKLGQNQYYTGNSKIFVPIVASAIKARKTRFQNQIFPKTGRYVDAVSDDGGPPPYAQIALAEHYIRRSGLRLNMPALLKNGDIEGQYTVYVGWNENQRFITKKVQKPLVAEYDADPGARVLDPDSMIDDIDEDQPVKQGFPYVEIIGDSDFLVLPATTATLDEAIDNGGSVTILRRWTKAKIKQLIKNGEIDKEVGKEALHEMAKDVKESQADKEKAMVNAAGIRRDGRGKYLLAYETWSLVEVDDEKKICRTYFMKPRQIGSCVRNPYWCDRLPIFSCPIDKTQGSFKGISAIEPGIKDLQYYANDVANEAADSSAFAMMPIIMTDPEKNPRVGSMVLALAAIWETSPNDTQFAKFPDLWKSGLEIIANIKGEIFQSLSVNPAQITQTNTKTKRNQAEIANEQQVDILTTADAVGILEEGILSPAVSFMMCLDYQFRKEPISVMRFGALGREADMQSIDPLKMDASVNWIWLGVESARNAQQMQQQIAALNMLRGIPPQMYQGYKIDLAPAITNMLEGVFGPRIAPRIFQDIRYQLSQDPEQENKLMLMGVDPFVHPLDDHQAHIRKHMEVIIQDPQGTMGPVHRHIAMHMQSMAEALTAQGQGMKPQGQPGSPGGSGPGVAGSPKPGAVPAQQRPMQQPAGAIHQDRLPFGMPRRT